MSLLTWLKFLRGDSRAIREIANCPQAVWLGLLFVLSAGIPREYDGEDLLREPYYLLVPLVASLATSFALYWVARILAGYVPAANGTSPAGYRGFLACYWMTAPMAWIYALPVERWNAESGAAFFNMWLLLIVATWRVVLMIQVVRTLFGVSTRLAVCAVLTFAFSVFAMLTWNIKMPVFYVMGGVRMSPTESNLFGALLLSRLASLVGLPVVLSWFGWALVSRMKGSRESSEDLISEACEPGASPNTPATGQRHVDADFSVPRVSWTLWAGAAALYLVGVPMLAAAQPEQQLRTRVEDLFRAGDLQAAVAVMSQHPQSDFPPHWQPPPRPAFGETKPATWKIYKVAVDEQAPQWVLDATRERLVSSLGESEWGARRYLHELGDPEEVIQFLSFTEETDDNDRIFEWVPYAVGPYIDSLEHENERSRKTPEEIITRLDKYRPRHRSEDKPVEDSQSSVEQAQLSNEVKSGSDDTRKEREPD